MRAFILITLIFHVISFYSLGQDQKKDTIDHYDQLESRYQKLKDSLSLSYLFTPAVSSVMVNNKQFEINLFNSLLSANKYRDENGNLYHSFSRNTYLFTGLQLTYGISKKARWNIGLDINSIAGRIDNDRNSSILKVFNSRVDGNSHYAKAITSIGPRIRWKPFRRNYHFTLQSSVIFSIYQSAEKEAVLGQNQTYVLTQFLYNQPLSKRLFLFPQIGLQYGFKNDNASSIFYSPATCYLGYLIPQKIILFSLINYIPIFRKDESWTYNAYTFQIGTGLQYYISKNILMNAYYAKDIKGKNYQDFNSYNIGLRFITH